jgi:hypothetical protein
VSTTAKPARPRSLAPTTRPGTAPLPRDAAARDSELDALRGERDRLRDLVATYLGEQAEVISEIEREIDIVHELAKAVQAARTRA